MERLLRAAGTWSRSVSGVDEAMDGGDPTKVRRFLQRLKPWPKAWTASRSPGPVWTQLVAALNQRDGDRCNRLHIGADEILTEQSSANPVRRWCRFLIRGHRSAVGAAERGPNLRH